MEQISTKFAGNRKHSITTGTSNLHREALTPSNGSSKAIPSSFNLSSSVNSPVPLRIRAVRSMLDVNMDGPPKSYTTWPHDSDLEDHNTKPPTRPFNDNSADSFGQSEMNSLSRQPRGVNRNLFDSKCSFCKEQLANGLAGEISIELLCGDACHKECLSIMLEQLESTKLPICGICGKETRSANDDLHSRIVKEVFLSPSNLSFPTDSPISVFRRYADIESHSYNTTPSSKITLEQSHNRRVEFNHLYIRELRSDLNKPRIVCSTDTNSITPVGEDSQELRYLVSVRPPQIFQKQEMTDKEREIKMKVISEMEVLLDSKVTNFKDNISFKELGELLLFDYLSISTNEIEWDVACVLLFAETIILVKDYRVIGKIEISKDISSVNQLSDGIIINLRNETMPELQLQHKNPAIISKWQTILLPYIQRNKVDEINLFQITSNAWNLIENIELPEDVQKFSKLIVDDSDIPSSYLLQTLGLPEALPLNIIISVPLFNSTGLSDGAYKMHLETILQSIRKSLRSFDKMGLIFLGRDGAGMAAKKGTFISCMDKEWEGWARIIGTINVYSDVDVFRNEAEEIKVCFEKLIDLSPFIPQSTNCINKFLILNCNNYADFPASTGLAVDKVLQKKIVNIITKISATIVRIGSSYTDGTENLNRIIANPATDFSSSSLSLSYGSKLIRFDSFKDFNESLSYLVKEKYQRICIPSVTVDISKIDDTQNIVYISEVEVNGEMIPLENVHKLSLMVKDQTPNTERNIMINVRIKNLRSNAVSEQQIEDYGEIPLFSYSSSWLMHQEETKVCHKRVSPLAAETDQRTMSNGSNTPIDLKKNSSFLDIPLLPPLSSNREQSFARRQTELSLLSALTTVEITPQNSNDIIMRSVSIAYGFIREYFPFNEEESSKAGSSSAKSVNNFCPGESLDLELKQNKTFRNNEEYVQFLVGHLNTINDLYSKDPGLAAVKCRDLCISLM
ncbi:uncharacterized protein RJT20DRAFT_51626 [Scheffersomyces xylosifermentans]|uniref:uncharacterized protein n=1 Tax=Scheffersomyces xylosifermentans TaxID=1304137 RepID=UPI00315D8418